MPASISGFRLLGLLRILPKILAFSFIVASVTPSPAAAEGKTAALTAGDQVSPADVPIPVDERGIRAAGIATIAIDRDRGGSDLMFPGTVVIPQQQIRVVAAPAGGLVEEMLVAADETVQAGQPIARLRSPAIVEAQRQFLAAIADDALAADRLRRSQLLFEGKALPERDLRVAQTEATQASSRLDERTQILSLMGMTDSEVATLRDSRKIFPTVTLFAPIDGTVTVRHTAPGERVEPAAPVFTIANLEPLWVNIQVPAARLPNLAVDAPVLLPAQGARGRIIRIGRTVDANTQSAIAVAEINSNNGAVRPGLAVSVAVRVATSTAGEWSVPAAAVVRHRDRTWIFLRNKAGFVARPVQVINEGPRGVSIRAAVTAGDQVAVNGILSLLSELADIDKE